MGDGPHATVDASDVAHTSPTRKARADGVTVVQAGVDEVPALGRFDTVVLVNVLEHIPDDATAVKVLAEALVPGGHLLLYVPAFDELYSEFDRRIGHHRRYRREELEARVAAAGLEVVDARYVNLVGAVAWWVLARQLRQTPTKRWSAMTFDRVAVPVVSRLERRWPPPFGQSILCVARRPG